MVKNFLKAARLRTLPLSVSGIVIGCFFGNAKINPEISVFLSPIFWLSILTTIGFQILSNFANDYGDGIKGSDNNRIGEERMVASGKISSSQMKKAMIITTVLTLAVALLLIFEAFGKENFGYSLLFIGLGVASIVAAIKYTVGSSPYGYSGFGDIFVFLFFGLLSVLGSYFLYTKQIEIIMFLPAITVGLLSTAVLNLNNMRDRNQDLENSKNTLAVKFGERNAKVYHTILIIGAFLASILFVTFTYQNPYQFIFLIPFGILIGHLLRVKNNKDISELDGELKVVALSTFLYAILFSVGNTLM